MRKWFVVGATLMTSLVCVWGVPLAFAAPSGGAAVFAQCPTHAVEVDGCLYGSIEGGYIALGKTVVPISRTIVLQAGMLEHEPSYVKPLAGALDGETLSKVGQAIPGLAGQLDATAELAAPASSITVINYEGNVRLTLPVKIRLEPGLGAECLIGSDGHPIEMYFTTGRSGALTGNPGRQSTIDEGRIVVKSGVTLVGSGFAVPKVSGCGTAAVDSVIDAMLGLPSSNASAKFNLKMEIANSSFVEDTEG